MAPEAAPPAAGGEASDGSAAPANPGQMNAIAAATKRQLIFTGDMSLQVADVARAMREAHEWVEAHEGWVDAESVSGEDEAQGGMTLRVPQAQYEPTRDHLRTLALDVVADRSQRQDVTGQHADLSARLKNLQATEVELREMLSQAREQGESTDDVLNIYAKLSEVRGNVEAMQSQLSTLEEQVAMSTLTVTFLPPPASPQTVTKGWQPGAVLQRALADLVAGLQRLVDMAIYLVVTAPLWLLPLLGLVLVLWIARRVWRRVRPAKPPAKPPSASPPAAKPPVNPPTAPPAPPAASP
jgi:hypothetical protein